MATSLTTDLSQEVRLLAAMCIYNQQFGKLFYFLHFSW